ncbi:hypothetical protein B23_2802 [Geobacillus thermoleovorans B23]|nr:hypothetical protein B23_2802 [Geobacillus thermoleovorans B23]
MPFFSQGMSGCKEKTLTKLETKRIILFVALR